MDLIYIAHPYTDNPSENLEDAKRIKRTLQSIYPNDCFVSPLDEFSDYVDLEYTTVLALCFKLLSKCDSIVFCKNWKQSQGCRAEMAFAKFKDIPIMYFVSGTMAHSEE